MGTESETSRERKTDPDLGRKLAEETQELSATVAMRIDSIDRQLEKHGKMLDRLFDLIAGKYDSTSGIMHGGFAKAFHDVNGHLSAIRADMTLAFEQWQSLGTRVAELAADVERIHSRAHSGNGTTPPPAEKDEEA